MEVIIERLYSRNEVEIYLKKQNGSVDTYFHFNGDHIETTNIEVNGCVQLGIKPLFKMPMHFSEALIKAFAKEAAGMNIETENENLLKGKLQAKEDHLQDLRTFTKKLMKID